MLHYDSIFIFNIVYFLKYKDISFYEHIGVSKLGNAIFLIYKLEGISNPFEGAATYIFRKFFNNFAYPNEAQLKDISLY